MQVSNENRVFNHVGISVPNLDEACKFYMEVFGFRKIRSDISIDRADTPEASVFKLYDSKLRKVKIAFLTCGNSVGFEICEFTDPPFKQPEPFDYARGGFFHVAVTVSDPDVVLGKVTEYGGKQMGEAISMFGEKTLCLQDP